MASCAFRKRLCNWIWVAWRDITIEVMTSIGEESSNDDGGDGGGLLYVSSNGDSPVLEWVEVL